MMYNWKLAALGSHHWCVSSALLLPNNRMPIKDIVGISNADQS